MRSFQPPKTPALDQDTADVLEEMARQTLEGLPEPRTFYAGIDWGSRPSQSVVTFARVVDGDLHIIRGED